VACTSTISEGVRRGLDEGLGGTAARSGEGEDDGEGVLLDDTTDSQRTVCDVASITIGTSADMFLTSLFEGLAETIESAWIGRVVMRVSMSRFSCLDLMLGAANVSIVDLRSGSDGSSTGDS
jgi:hypothetical protein